MHHIEPVRAGGDPFDLANLATVCARHHGIWEQMRRREDELRHALDFQNDVERLAARARQWVGVRV